MNTVLSPGEIAIGQRVTVLSNEMPKQEQEASSDGYFGGTFSFSSTLCRDTSYEGDVLIITAVALPFVLVNRVAAGGEGRLDDNGTNIKLDTRKLLLMELPDNYVAAMMKSHKGLDTLVQS